jgi:CRP-like cAMP-binding protein
VIFEEGEASDEVFFILRGHVELFANETHRLSLNLSAKRDQISGAMVSGLETDQRASTDGDAESDDEGTLPLQPTSEGDPRPLDYRRERILLGLDEPDGRKSVIAVDKKLSLALFSNSTELASLSRGSTRLTVKELKSRLSQCGKDVQVSRTASIREEASNSSESESDDQHTPGEDLALQRIREKAQRTVAAAKIERLRDNFSNDFSREEISQRIQQEDWVHVGTVGPMRMIGEWSLMNEQKRLANGVAGSAVEAFVLKRSEYWKAMQSQGAVDAGRVVSILGRDHLEWSESDRETLLALLSQSTFFLSYSDALKIALLQAMQLRSYEFDDMLFDEGDIADGFYIILSGRVGLYKRVSTSLRHVLDMDSGAIVGEWGMISGKPRTACARCLGHTQLLFAEGSTFATVQAAYRRGDLLRKNALLVAKRPPEERDEEVLRHSLIPILRNIPILASCPAEVLLDVARHCVLRRFVDGDSVLGPEEQAVRPPP